MSRCIEHAIKKLQVVCAWVRPSMREECGCACVDGVNRLAKVIKYYLLFFLVSLVGVHTWANTLVMFYQFIEQIRSWT